MMDYMKIKDRDKRIEFLNNTHLKKGQKFKLVGVKPWWEEMGVTEMEWNDGNGVDDCMVLNGKLFEREKETKELVEIVWSVPRDMTYSQLLGDWVDCSWTNSPLYHDLGLLVESEFQFKFIKNTDIDRINKPLGIFQPNESEVM